MSGAVASHEDGDVASFVLQQSRLVSLERAEEVNNAAAVVQQMAEKDAVKAGLSLTRLVIADCTTGLYGRSLLTFVSAVDALLPATQIGVRDIVSIQPKGAAAATTTQQGGWSLHSHSRSSSQRPAEMRIQRLTARVAPLCCLRRGRCGVPAD